MNNFKILYFEQIGSTNSYLKENASSLEDKTVVCAGIQTNGRGRFTRTWQSSNNQNIYASILLKPEYKNIENSPLANLTQYLAVIICDIFKKYYVTPKIKWPNDIQVNGKKISGILAETKIDDNGFINLILGFGINLNLSQEEVDSIDQPATSLNLETGREVDKDKFLKSLLDAFFAEYETFLSQGFGYIKSRYIEKCSFIGNEISIKNLDSKVSGVAKSINDDGSLELCVLGEQNNIKILAGDMIC